VLSPPFIKDDVWGIKKLTMYKICCCILFTWIATKAMCQNNISGVVRNNSGNGISYATLRFVQAKDTIHPTSIKIADEMGLFFIQLKDTGFYYIYISATGYSDTTIKVNIRQTNTNQDIVLSQNKTQLGDVIISAKLKPPMIQRKIDRVVMNIDNNPLTAGKSSLDIFKLAPGVFVNGNTISINGMTGSKVMVNGQLLKLSGSDLTQYLQSLRSNEIKSIEVIAHPPAEYDAEGTGGLINIVLKKNARNGLIGSIGTDYSLGLGKYPQYNPYASLNYKRNKLELSARYANYWSKFYQQIDQTRNLNDPLTYQSRTNTKSYIKANRITLGASYQINRHHSLDIGYTGLFNNIIDSSISNTKINSKSDISQNIISNGVFTNGAKANYSDFGLNYKWVIDTLGSGFTILSDYIYNAHNGNNYNSSKTYNNNNEPTGDTLFIFLNPNKSKIWTTDMKFKKVYTSGFNLSFGAKSTITRIQNNNRYQIADNNQWKDSPEKDFQYKYTENILAGYINLSGQLIGIDFKLGLRGENSKVEGKLAGVNQNDTTKKTYFDLFPAIFFKRELGSQHNAILSFSYNRRISRPGYSILNPYRYYIDNYSVSTGNPLVHPMYTNAVELGLNLKQKYYISVNYSQISNTINQVIETSDVSPDMVITSKNAGNNKTWAVTLSAPMKITKWWTSNNNLVLNYINIKASEFNISKGTFILQSQQSFEFQNLFKMTLGGFYTPRIIRGNFITGRIASIDWGISKSFFDKHLELKANLSDIFYTNNFRAVSYFNDTKLKLRQLDQTRLLTLSLVYNFNLGKSFKAKKIQSSNIDENGRL